LNRLEVWKRQGAELRGELEKELRELEKRATDIRAALKMLPAVAEGPREPRPASISGLIRGVLSAHPGISAGEIVTHIRALRPDVKPRVVHAILYRLRLEKQVRAEGERGGMKYFPADFPADFGPAPEDNIPRGRLIRKSGPPYKAVAAAFFEKNPGRHAVAEVAKSIGLDNMDQARNILVRLCNDRVIKRVSEGVYERIGSREGAIEANTNP